MRVWWRIVLAVVALAAGIVLFAPAALLDAALASRTGQRVHLVDTNGWWWRGRGAIASNDGTARLPVAWRVAFAPLLRGTVEVELRAHDDPGMPTGTISLHDGTLDMRDVHVHAPASFVPAFAPALQAFSLRGDVAVHAASFAWRRNAPVGAFEATWEHAGIGSAGFVVDLGRVSAKASPADAGIAGTVRNAGGDVAVDGRIDARAGGIDVTFALTPAQNAADALRAMLPLLGTPDASGRVQLTWHADWR